MNEIKNISYACINCGYTEVLRQYEKEFSDYVYNDLGDGEGDIKFMYFAGSPGEIERVNKNIFIPGVTGDLVFKCTNIGHAFDIAHHLMRYDHCANFNAGSMYKLEWKSLGKAYNRDHKEFMDEIVVSLTYETEGG